MKIQLATALVALLTCCCCTAHEIADNGNPNNFSPLLQDDRVDVGHKIDHRELQRTTLFELIEQDPELSTLENALEAASLMLTGTTYTIFAPVDGAFEALDPALLTQLSTPEFILHLQNLLSFHIAEGAFYAFNLSNGLKITMLNGESITVRYVNGIINLVGGASGPAVVAQTDIAASNGVMHKLTDDFILLPNFVATDIYDLLAADPNYSTLVAAIDSAGLEDSLRTGTLTILAPDNAAFAALPRDTRNAILTNPQKLQDTLLYHTVEGSLPSTLVTPGPLPTLYPGQKALDVKIGNDGTITLDGVPVVKPDRLARNGIVHGISGVLLPDAVPVPAPTSRPVALPPVAPPSVPTPLRTLLELVAQDPELSTLETAFAAAPLSLNRPPYTLFAPVDEVFDTLDPAVLTQLLTPEFNLHLQNILSYHLAHGAYYSRTLSNGMMITMLNGESITIRITNGVIKLEGGFFLPPVVIEPDIRASDGVMHKISGGLLLPKFMATDIYDVLVADPNYSTLVAAIDATGLEDSLRTGTLTVLAPDNEAFSALSDGFLEALLADPEALQDLLLYHVVEGSLPSTLVEPGSLPTLYDGLALDVRVGRNGRITFNGIPVVVPDILARNGIIHGISGVLIPPIVPVPTVAPAPVPTVPVPAPTPTYVYPPGSDQCLPWTNPTISGRRRTEFRASSYQRA